MSGRFEASVEGYFAAAHALRGYKGKCERLHGHNWRVRLAVEGAQLNPLGMLMDFAELKKLLAGILDGLDHKYLNDEAAHFKTVNPSTEELARYVAAVAAEALPAAVRVAWVEVEEAPGARARYTPRP